MRVIAGIAKGRRLVVPEGGRTRAATDRIRETLFGILTPVLIEADVLDLFAGSGALGIEALSRGAGHATFVERDARAVAAIARNLETAGLADRATVIRADVLAYLSGPARADIAFCDPPFADVETHGRVLAKLAAPDRLIVSRALRKHLPAIPATLRITRTKEIGEETLLLLQYSEEASAGG
ncbi:MAG TPA: 16S rRNA (guanine(966)-N(2))-methyltransferase RsmD [Candidatus Limnocylindria bacterium]|jgi:16S rRNA (guanine966-N2)-methyltransferase